MKCLLPIALLIAGAQGGVSNRHKRWEWNRDDTHAHRDDIGHPESGGMALGKLGSLEMGSKQEFESVHQTRDLDTTARQTYGSAHPRGEDMVLKGTGEEGAENEQKQPPPSTAGGWGLPSVASVKGWASSAYSYVPSAKTATSYLPEGVQTYLPSAETVQSYLPSAKTVQSYLPSAETVQSYLPSAESVAARVPDAVKNPKLYATQRLLGSALPADETERFANAVSDQIMKGESADLGNVVAEVGQKAAVRAAESAAPQVIRAVVRKVVLGMVIAYVGVYAAGLATSHLNQLSDAIADRAIEQYLKYDGPYKLDLASYMKTVNWTAIANRAVELAKASIAKG